jgi:predicted Zn-ribbon and HTH transcriptional regulator
MAETSLKPLKAILETIREQADFALKQLQASEEERSMRWKCKDCEYVKHFTRPVPLEAAGRCPRCKAIRGELLKRFKAALSRCLSAPSRTPLATPRVEVGRHAPIVRRTKDAVCQRDVSFLLSAE